MIVAVQGLRDLAYVTGGTALPTANANLITAGDVSCSAGRTGAILVEFWPSVAGVLSVKVTKGSTSTSAALLGATASAPLAAGMQYQDIILIGYGETVNFTYSVTSGSYRLVVREI